MGEEIKIAVQESLKPETRSPLVPSKGPVVRNAMLTLSRRKTFMKTFLGSILGALALTALVPFQSTSRSLVSGLAEAQPDLPDGRERD
jgi:hypothetical protein